MDAPLTRFSRPATVFVAGRDAQVTQALERLLDLDTSIQVVGTARRATVRALGAAAPDVVLCADDPTSVPLALQSTRKTSPATVVCLLDALRELNVSEFLEAVKAMSGPATTAPPRRMVGPDSQSMRPRSMRDVLSARELQVVRLVAEGLSNKEISARLSLSDKTVKNHISHILAKLNLNARTQVAVLALRSGVV